MRRPTSEECGPIALTRQPDLAPGLRFVLSSSGIVGPWASTYQNKNQNRIPSPPTHHPAPLPPWRPVGCKAEQENECTPSPQPPTSAKGGAIQVVCPPGPPSSGGYSVTDPPGWALGRGSARRAPKPLHQLPVRVPAKRPLPPVGGPCSVRIKRNPWCQAASHVPRSHPSSCPAPVPSPCPKALVQRTANCPLGAWRLSVPRLTSLPVASV